VASPMHLVPGSPLISAAEISGRLGELAAEVDTDYAGRDLLLLGVLRGAMMVTADLARLLENDRVEVDWLTDPAPGARR
jgi:hypoxanthine phosphoribosyltransferase